MDDPFAPPVAPLDALPGFPVLRVGIPSAVVGILMAVGLQWSRGGGLELTGALILMQCLAMGMAAISRREVAGFIAAYAGHGAFFLTSSAWYSIESGRYPQHLLVLLLALLVWPALAGLVACPFAWLVRRLVGVP